MTSTNQVIFHNHALMCKPREVSSTISQRRARHRPTKPEKISSFFLRIKRVICIKKQRSDRRFELCYDRRYSGDKLHWKISQFRRTTNTKTLLRRECNVVFA